MRRLTDRRLWLAVAGVAVAGGMLLSFTDSENPLNPAGWFRSSPQWAEQEDGPDDSSSGSGAGGTSGKDRASKAVRRGGAGGRPGQRDLAGVRSRERAAGGGDAEGGPPGIPPPEIKEWGLRLVAQQKSSHAVTADELNRYLNSVTPENWKEALEAILPLYDTLHHDRWGGVMRRMGAVAGRDVMEHFRPGNTLVDYEGYGARHAMRAWAGADREAALHYIESLPEGRFRDGMVIGFLRAGGNVTASSLETFYEQLPQSLWPQIAAAQRDMIRWEPPNANAAVKEWLADTGRTHGADSARYRMVQEAVDLHLLEGAMWDKNATDVSALTKEYFARDRGAVTDRTLNTALQNQARFEPQQAMELATAQLADRPTLAVSVPVIMSNWAAADSGAAGDWLNGHRTSPVYDQAAAAYALELRSEDQIAASSWAATIKSEALRRATQRKITDAK